MLVGLIESDQWARRHKTAAGAGKTYEEFLKGMAGRIPLGRMGKAEEFARIYHANKARYGNVHLSKTAAK